MASLPERSIAAESIEAPRLGEPYLLTPGPLTTAFDVKQAMLRDWGSWDDDFRAMTRQLRHDILSMLEQPDATSDDAYDCVPMQGSGTFSVEAMLGSLLPRTARALVLANGAYGKRIVQTLEVLGRSHQVIDKGDFLPPRGEEVSRALKADPSITHVIVVHCETSSGILNPLREIADATVAAGRRLLVDSMSAFGALPVSTRDIPFDALVSSSNKCIEGVPGFGFVIARKSLLIEARGCSHSLSLDVHAQWEAMERTGQWRFTPPTHVVAAFMEALRLHREAGGVAARGARYAANRDALVAGMRELGFETLLPDRWLSPIIVTFFNPADERFAFDDFYTRMKACGFIIYPGKLTEVDSFRIGCIGQMDTAVMQEVVAAAGSCLEQMGVSDARPPAAARQQQDRLAG